MPRPPVIKTKKVEPQKKYCRMCQSMLNIDKFYEATNPLLDKNGYMSICKDHCNEIYDMYFSIHNNLEIALQLTCEDLDVRFSEEALIQAKSHIESLVTKGKTAEKVFGYYKSKLSTTHKSSSKMDSFRYKDSDICGLQNDIYTNEEDSEIDEDLKMFWGKNFTFEDLMFLENELSNWKKTHKCDNQAELTLLREICITILEIRNERADSKPTKDLKKELQDLMKTASVDPAKANAASAGKSHDCYGLWVKDTEQFTPAEWFEQQEKYKDMDGFVPYLKNYIARPIENFLTGVRNFFVDDNIDADLDTADIGTGEGDS